MTNRLWPADAVGGAPAYSGRALRQTQAPFLAAATTVRPLGARSGVRPGTATNTVYATATAWTCASHAGVLDVQTAAEAGPYTYAIDTAVSGTMVASNASNPRTDIVYVQVTDAAEDGAAPGQSPVVTVGYLAGTAAANPTAPATPARSIVLARINVPKTGGGNPSVTWVAPYAVAAGAPLALRTLAELKLIPGWDGGTANVFADPVSAFNNGHYFWNSSAGVWAHSKSFDVTPPAVLLGSIPPAGARRIVQEGIATVRTTGAGTGDATLSLPIAFPNGIVTAIITRHDFSVGDTTQVTNASVQSLDAVNFRVYQSNGGGVPQQNLRVNYSVVGW